MNFKKFLICERSDDVSYGCLMADLKASDRKKFKDFTDKHIDKSKLGEYGVEKECHVTVLYGFHKTVATDKIKEFVETYGACELELGKVSKFSTDKYDVIKITVNTPSLKAINKACIKEFGKSVTLTHGTSYRAHLTLAYVEKGSHDHLIGDKNFEGDTFPITELTYSEAGDGKSKIQLKGE